MCPQATHLHYWKGIETQDAQLSHCGYPLLLFPSTDLLQVLLKNGLFLAMHLHGVVDTTFVVYYGGWKCDIGSP
jgi:hypothetical protein